MCAKTVYEYNPEMESYLISPGSIDETLDFESIFGNTNPVEIEIGTGKGRFILAESLKRPETNFLGIERSLKYLRIALSRAARAQRPNYAFLCLNADMVVKLLVRPKSVTAYHVYFPDPWPKDRHQKRRLFNPRLIEKMAETLIEDGILYLKSDSADYFTDARERIITSGLFQEIENTAADEPIQYFEEANGDATHYEIKWRKEGRIIYSGVYQVQSSA